MYFQKSYSQEDDHLKADDFCENKLSISIPSVLFITDGTSLVEFTIFKIAK